MSVTFLKAHYFLFFISLVFGILLLPVLEIVGLNLLKYKKFFTLKSVKTVFFLLAILFLFFGYLTKPVYYNPKTIGTIGDDYFQMSEAMKKQGNLQPQHIMKPYLIEKFIVFCEKLGILNENDPLYLEKAVKVASFPTRILTVIGLMAIFGLGFLFFDSFYIGLLFLFFLGTSFSIWAFGVMHNSIGSAIAMTMLTYYVGICFLRNSSSLKAFLFGMVTALCVFTHSTIGYFCIGIFFYIVYWLFSKNDIEKKLKINYFLAFCVGASSVALFYYFVLANYFKTGNIFVLINYISDSGYKTNILSAASIKRFYSSIMQYSLNVFNVWQPKNFFESFLIFLQISGLVSAFLITFKNLKNTDFKKNINFLFLFIIPFFAIILGFLFLQYEYYHYLDVGTVPLILCLLFFLFMVNNEAKDKIKIILSLLIVVISFFIYNSFSSHNIFQFRDINSSPIYANYNFIYENLKISNNKQAVFLTYDDYQPYFYAYMQAYYKKFEAVERKTDFPKNKIDLDNYLDALLSNNKEIFVDGEIVTDIENILDKDKYELSQKNDRIFYLKTK